MVKLSRPLNQKQKRSSRVKQVDLGTPELQAKRNAIFQSCTSPISFPERKSLHSKIKEGCLLHRLFWQKNLTKSQLEIGLFLRKLYHKAFRSMGIQTRLKSINGRLGSIKGRSLDTFECSRIERKWRFIANFLSTFAQKRQITPNVLDIILHDKKATLLYPEELSKISIKMIQTVLDETEKMINKWK